MTYNKLRRNTQFPMVVQSPYDIVMHAMPVLVHSLGMYVCIPLIKVCMRVFPVPQAMECCPVGVWLSATCLRKSTEDVS